VTAKSILKGKRENEILNFSPLLLVPLDTLISLPPSFFYALQDVCLEEKGSWQNTRVAVTNEKDNREATVPFNGATSYILSSRL
jgi:hypothetical protein